MEKPLTKWLGLRFVALLLSCILSVSMAWGQTLKSSKSAKNNAKGNAFNVQIPFKQFGSDNASDRCLATELSNQMLAKYPNQNRKRAEIEKRYQESKNGKIHREIAPEGSVRTIPVYVHVVWNTNNPQENLSDAQIQSQIDVLNEDFTLTNADISNLPAEFDGLQSNFQMQFVLAGIDRRESSVTLWDDDEALKDFDSGGLSTISPQTSLNIWVANISALGYAYFPGTVPDNLDGVVCVSNAFGSIDYDTNNDFYLHGTYNLGRTTTHEIGHYLNLHHTFNGGCSGGDDVDDTPAISAPHFGCPDYPTAGCSETAMTMNYMDYVDDACMYLFTEGQKARSAPLFASGGFRENLGSIGTDDGVPPTAIADLAASNPGVLSIDLSWTAPEDLDENNENPISATGYDIRYSTDPISNDTDFDNATEVDGEPAPKAPGEAETFTVGGLSPNTTYYFAIKSSNLFGSMSGLSNMVSETTLSAPEITVSVTEITETHDGAGPFNSNFTIGNLGGGDLNFEITSMEEPLGAIGLALDNDNPATNLGFGAGASITTASKMMVPESGSFNLTHIVNHFSTEGTDADITIDVVMGGVTPADGTLLTTQTYTGVNSGTESEWMEFALDAPQAFVGGDVFWIVFKFPNTIAFPQGTDDIGNTESGIALYSGDNGETYSDIIDVPDFTTEIWKMKGLMVSNWLTLSPTSGTVDAATIPERGDNESEITVTFDRSELPDGTYNAEIKITSNDPLVPGMIIPVELTVTGGVAAITVNTDPVDFGLVASGAEVWFDLPVMNSGLGDLTVDAALTGDEDFSIDTEGQMTIPAGEGDMIRVTFTAGAIGAKTATLTLTTNDPNAASVQISILGESTPPPVIGVNAESFSFDLVSSEMADATLSISNDGEGADLLFGLAVSDVDAGVLRNINMGTIPPVVATNKRILNNTAYNEKVERSSSFASKGKSEFTARDNHDNSVVLFAEDFDGEGFPQDWTVTDDAGNGFTWGLNSQVSGQGNLTGGSGESATVDSDAAGTVDIATQLISPAIPVAGFENVVLEYLVDYRALSDNFDLDISTDGGNSWTNIIAWTTDHRGEHIAVNLDEFLTGASEFWIRYNYYNANWAWWAQVDNIVIYGDDFITVDPLEGSVAAGTSSDVNIHVEAGARPGGTYERNLNVWSNDPQNEHFVIPVSMTVTEIPVINVAETADFGDVFLGQNGEGSLMVSNDGPKELVIWNMATDNGDFAFHTRDYVAVGDGANQLPDPVETEAGGGILAHIVHGESASVLVVYGDFENLSSAYTASHIHIGGAEETGDVLFTLDASVSEDGMSGEYRPDDNIFVLNDDIMGMLTSGGLYWNLHTTDNGSGELRGQLLPGTVIDPGEEKELHLSFSPSAAGENTGNLTLSHNDPLHGNSSVIALTGNGVEPPVAVVTPTTLDFTVAFGDETVDAQAFNIDNTAGGSVLAYENSVSYSGPGNNRVANNSSHSHNNSIVVSDADINKSDMCGTMKEHERLMATDPAYRTLQENMKANSENAKVDESLARAIAPEGAKRRIPVYVHVVWNQEEENISDAQVHSQISALNHDFGGTNTDAALIPDEFADRFADYQMEFEIVGITRTQTSVAGFANDGTNAIKFTALGGHDAITPETHINFWVGPLTGGLLGYAQFPGGPRATDGIVMRYSSFGSRDYDTNGDFVLLDDYDLGRVTSHELGHLFGLAHIWGDINGGGCGGDDEVEDTPLQENLYRDCPAYPSSSCGSNDMTMNYMDYTDDACHFMFTNGQKMRTAPLFAEGGYRENQGEIVTANPWLTLSSDEGTVDAGTSQGVDAMINLTDLEAGEYHAMVRVNTNDPANPTDHVMVNLTITGAPNLIIAPESIDFSDTTWAGTWAMTELMLINGTDENPATAPLHVTEVSAGGAFEVMDEGMDDEGIWIPRGDTVWVGVKFHPEAAGDYTGTLTVVSNDPSSAISEVQIVGTAITGPVANVSPAVIDIDVPIGGSNSTTMTIANGGSADLEYELFAGLNIDVNKLNNIVNGAKAINIPAEKDITNDPAYAAKLEASRNTVQATSSNAVSRIDNKEIIWLEDFEAASGTYPSAWTLLDNTGEGPEWNTTTFWARGNETGGSGDAAAADSDKQGSTTYDSDMITPAISTSGYQNFSLEYKVDFRTLSGDALRLDISVDGENWTNISDWVGEDHREEFVQVDINDMVGDADEFWLRWNYSGSGWNWWAQVDDVVILADLIPVVGVDPSAGTVAAEGSDEITVTVDATTLLGGTYHYAVNVLTNDPFKPWMMVPVNINVTGGTPVMTITSDTEPEDSIFFDDAIVGLHPEWSGFVIENTGTDVLIVGGATDNSDFWLASDNYFAFGEGGNQIPDPVETTGEGWIRAHVEEHENGDVTLSVWGEFANLSSTYTASHIHMGDAASNGDVVYTLTATLDDGDLGGHYRPEDNTFELTEDQWNNLKDGMYYWNLHTTDNAGGEIRGQLWPGGAIEPGESVEVPVAFSPSSEGLIEGTLSLFSNDPNNGEASIYLAGNGVGSPVTISVNPTEMEQTLEAGGNASQTLTISNAGPDNLEFGLSVEMVDGDDDDMRMFTLPAKTSAARGNGTFKQSIGNSSEARTFNVNHSSHLRNGAINIMIITPDDDVSDVEAMLGAFPEFNVTRFPEVDLPNITLADLDGYDVVFTTNNQQWLGGGGVEPAVIGDLLADFIDAGGKAIVNAFAYDYDAWAMAGRFIDEGYGPFTATSTDFNGTSSLGTVHEPGHPIMDGVTAVTNSYLWQNPGVAPGAIHIADWNDGSVMVAANENAVAFNVLPSDGNGIPGWTGDLPLMYYNAIMSFGGGAAGFISFDIDGGSVEAGQTQDVEVTFDAAEIVAGVYEAEIIVDNNDPFNQGLVVPVTITVTGTPGIEVNVSSIEFDEVLIGDDEEWEFVITNTGTAPLEVTDITITGSDFSVDETSGVIAPGEDGEVTVTYAPSVAETIAEVLKVHSNAGTETVILSGTGLTPPAVIAVDPGHLEAELLNDETATDAFTVSNSGEGDLEYMIVAIPARMGEGQNSRGVEVNTNGYAAKIKTAKSDLTENNVETQRDDHEDIDILEELGYDPDRAPDSFVGTGGDAHSLATRFWSEEGFILTHVRNFFRTENEFIENIGIRILVGDDINGAQMLTHQVVTDKSIEGEFMLIELDQPQVFAPGETFWVVYDYPNGMPYPQGYNTNVPNVNELYYVDLGGGFAPVENFIPGAAFKHRAIMDGNYDGGSSVGWLELDASSGTVASDGSTTINVTYTPDGLESGHYAADILVFSNDPVNDVENVRVDLMVGNRAPMAVAQIEDQTMEIDSEPFTVDLSTIFADPDGDNLHVWSTTDNDMVAETDVEDGILWVWAKASGEADITVRAEDPSGALAQVDFVVTVPAVAGNNAPTLEAEFADITVEYDGESAFIDVSPNFADADGDALNYWATASNANVSVDGLEGNSILEVEPNVVGTAEVTVWAADGKGGEISDTFMVTVQFTGENNAPEVVMTFDDQTIELDHTWSHNLAGVFHDADGDDLHHWATSDDESIAHGWVDENGLHVTGNKVGNANITVWAADGKGGEASTTFAVTVEFTDENADPHVAMEIEDQDLEIGGSSYTIDLRTVFGDADGDNLDFWASSDNVYKATAMVEGTVLVVEPQQGGTANITVWATDNKGGTDAMDDFMVTIVDNSNTAPTIAAAIDDKIILPGANTDVVDLSTVFTDAEGDALTYTATTDDASIADIAIDGSNLTVTSGVVGMVNIKVWADDGNSPAAMDEYMVTVNTSPETSGLGDQTILMGGSNLSIDVSGSFSDADGDNLTYSASSSDDSKATVSVEGSTVMVNQVDAGTSTITVTATDPQNGSVSADFLVTLEANDDPTVASAIGAQTLRLEQDPFTVDLSTVFGDANSDPLTYSASSNNEGVATVSITDGMLTVNQVAAGNAFISVWADDQRGGTRAEDGFGVEVTENQKPTATGTIADSNQEFGVDLTTIFTDADGDAMTFNASSSDEAIAAVAISGNNMVVAHIAVGTATITVTATDSNGATSDPLTFEATVSITTGLEDEILSESLIAYPNPAFDIATIKYELKEASDVSLAVYDLNGKMVQLLVNEKQAAGIHTSKLDVSQLSSGVYLYRIIANGKSFTKKLTIR